MIAVAVGTLMQVAMTVVGHYEPPLRAIYAFGGMGFSLVAGAVYARVARSGWGDSLVGGATGGGTCGLIGIAVSFMFDDVPAMLMLFGTAASSIAGAAGAAIGRLSLKA